MLYVPDYSDDLGPGHVGSVERVDLYSLADRVLAGEVAPGEAAADDRDEGAFQVIPLGEISSGKQRYAHDVEVALVYNALVAQGRIRNAGRQGAAFDDEAVNLLAAGERQL